MNLTSFASSKDFTCPMNSSVGKLSLEHIAAYENELKKGKHRTDRVLASRTRYGGEHARQNGSKAGAYRR